MLALPRILVVEDQAEILHQIPRETFDREFALALARDADEARERMGAEHFDAYLLDWDLATGSCLELVRAIRGQLLSVAPILVLTARATTEEHTLALNTGADDFLTKPFAPEVLASKLRALLRRARYAPGAGPVGLIEAGRLVIDLGGHEARLDGRRLPLTASEFRILAALARHRRRALSREQLIDLIRGSDVAIVERAIDTHVSSLRKKLGPASELIETIRSVGYRMK